jgi:CheY-like chemotaxis protein
MSRILVVEDDPAIRKLTSTALSSAGHRVRVAANGVEALRETDVDTPDLVVTDIMMPQMDGWELVKQLRARRNTAFTPVLFLTQLDSYADRVRGFRLGADDYITKPFSPSQLVHSVSRMTDPEAVWKETAGVIDPGADMEGRLERIGLSAVLTMLEATQKSGVLTLSNGGDSCRIWLREGRVIRATLKSRPELPSTECVYRAIAWAQGSFEFMESSVAGKDEVELATTYLLIEGARRIDEVPGH